MLILGAAALLLSCLLGGNCLGDAPPELYYGGSYDGYDSCDIENTSVKDGLPAGTVFMMK